tara:strand:+ start:2924 stop:3592 length:669 start_codon:yes stop_codon:yes gene_type:complete
MNKKTKLILQYSVIAAAMFTVSIVLINKFFTKSGKTAFKKKLIDVTNQEHEHWGNGTIRERDPSMYQRLKDYWDTVGWSESRWSPPQKEPWSAAFISYVMKKAGAGDDFKYDASHSTYIRQAVKNKKENNSNPFKAYKLNDKEATPKVGDLVCYSRESTIDLYDRTSGYKSHCDIVVSQTPDSIDLIGGNVGHTVKKKTLQLNENGTVKKTGKWFTVIKNAK